MCTNRCILLSILAQGIIVFVQGLLPPQTAMAWHGNLHRTAHVTLPYFSGIVATVPGAQRRQMQPINVTLNMLQIRKHK